MASKNTAKHVRSALRELDEARTLLPRLAGVLHDGALGLGSEEQSTNAVVDYVGAIASLDGAYKELSMICDPEVG